MFRKFALNDSISKIRRIKMMISIIITHCIEFRAHISVIVYFFFIIKCMRAVGSQRNCLTEMVPWVPTAYA